MNKRLLLSSGIAVALTGSPAFSQALDEIVVSAQKREQNIQDVPVAVSAFDSQSLREQGIQEIVDLNFASPSVNFTVQQNKVSNNPLRIRGFGTTGTNPAFEGAVGTYIDGVYRSRPGFALATFNDIQNLEILRGPQGTLFGKNTSSGAVLLTSNRPDFEPAIGMELTLGNFDRRRISGYVNYPITDNLAIRLSAIDEQTDGFFVNPVTGQDAFGTNQTAFKGQLLWQPTDRLSALIIGDWATANENGADARSARLEFGAPAAEAFYESLAAANNLPFFTEDPFDREVATNFPSNDQTDEWGINGQLTFDLTDNITVKSISSYRIFNYDQNNFDLDFGPVDLAGPTGLNEEYQFETFSQEINISGSFDNIFDGVDYIVGGYYSNETIDFDRLIDTGSQLGTVFGFLFDGVLGAADFVGFPGLGDGNPLVPQVSLIPGGPSAANGFLPSAITPGVPFLDATFDHSDEVFAIFAHADIAVSEKFHVVGGVRYNNEDKTGVLTNNRFPGDPLGQLADIQANNFALFLLGASTVGNEFDSTQSDREVTWDVALQYFPTDDIQLYAKVSRGFKAGGVSLNVDAGGGVASAAAFAASGGTNPFTPIVSPNYNPEFVLAYEAGAKFGFLDGRGRGAITGFYQDYTDIQFSIFTGTAFATFNASDAVSAGIEFESSFAVTENLTVDGSLTWLIDASFGDNLVDPDNPALLPGIPGRDFTHAPTLASVVNVNYERPLNDQLTWFVNGAWSYFGDHFLEIELSTIQEGYSQGNLSAGIADIDGRWRLSAWARNVTDTEFAEIAFNQPFTFTGNAVSANLGPPRTWGVTISANF